MEIEKTQSISSILYVVRHTCVAVITARAADGSMGYIVGRQVSFKERVRRASLFRGDCGVSIARNTVQQNQVAHSSPKTL